MKPYLHLVLLSTLWLVAPLSAASNSAPETFGNSVGEGETVPIAEILADPEGFEGKEVRIEGTVSDVCPKKGCWMELRQGEEGPAVRVPMAGHSFFLPRDVAGRHARIEGRVAMRELSPEARAHHESEGAQATASALLALCALVVLSGDIIHLPGFHATLTSLMTSARRRLSSASTTSEELVPVSGVRTATFFLPVEPHLKYNNKMNSHYSLPQYAQG